MLRWTGGPQSATQHWGTPPTSASQVRRRQTAWTGYTCGRGAWQQRQLLPDSSSSCRWLVPLSDDVVAVTLANYMYWHDCTVLTPSYHSEQWERAPCRRGAGGLGVDMQFARPLVVERAACEDVVCRSHTTVRRRPPASPRSICPRPVKWARRGL